MNQVRTHQPYLAQDTQLGKSESEDCSRTRHHCGQPGEFCHEGMQEPEVTGKACLTYSVGRSVADTDFPALALGQGGSFGIDESPGPALGQAQSQESCGSEKVEDFWGKMGQLGDAEERGTCSQRTAFFHLTH